MLYGILKKLTEAVGMKFVSIPGELFERGIDPRLVEMDADLSRTGFCFGGFRFCPDLPMRLIDTARTILLVRDPRDAVVSLYFSARDSHQLPGPDGALRRRMMARRQHASMTPLDEWVVENHGAVLAAVTSYITSGFLRRPNVVIYRYEDVIYRKRAWVQDILAWYGWQVRANVVDDIVRSFDTFPEKPDSRRHVRQVHPGNHKEMLKPATCERLDSCFAHVLEVLGYAAESGAGI